jgi:hypothetical protein
MLVLGALLASAASSARWAAAPRFEAVIQIHQVGIRQIDGSGRITRGIFRRYSRDAVLAEGPGSSFAIVDNQTVSNYDGRRCLCNLSFPGPPNVIGWSAGWPIIAAGGRVFLTTDGSKTVMPRILNRTQEIAGTPSFGFLCALTYSERGTDFSDRRHYAFFRGKTLYPLTGIGDDAGNFVVLGGNAVVGTTGELKAESQRFYSNGSLWLVSLLGQQPKLLAHHDQTEWFVSWPDREGRLWITESSYEGPFRKFYRSERIYRYSVKDGLVAIAQTKGDFYAYGDDSTGQWLVGERVYGYEMGAYDLVARKFDGSSEVNICHGVEEFQSLDQ